LTVRQSVSPSTRPAIRLKEPKNGTPGPVNASVNPWRARAEHAAHVLPTLLWPGVSLSGGRATSTRVAFPIKGDARARLGQCSGMSREPIRHHPRMPRIDDGPTDRAAKQRVADRMGVAGALGIMLLVAACSSSGSKSRTTTTKTTGVVVPQWATYRRACENESDVCAGPPESISGSLPTKLIRPLHFPSATGTRCPATPGHYVTTPDFGSWTLGNGRVRVAINNPGDLRHGKVNMGTGGASGWHGMKTHFFSVPAYQGPFLVRAKRLDRSGPIRLGESPTQAAPLVVPSGPTPNGSWWLA
jgi:hypothetical protein